MRNDIVVQTRLYLEFEYLTIFALALMYSGVQATEEMAVNELERWKKTGKVVDFVNDFCLDVLSKRILVKWNPLKPLELELRMNDEPEGLEPETD